MVRLLHTTGNGKFEETRTYNIPDTKQDEIRVRAVMTGVCRSDIAMMNGTFGMLPLHMQGHEGLGEVLEIGEDIKDVEEGDLVATRGEPAYADEYNANFGTYVKVPRLDPKYIIEPVACGLNVVMQDESQFEKRNTKGAKLLIIGSGFLAWVVYQYLNAHYFFDVEVLGSSNKELWGDKLKDKVDGGYDIIVDLNTRDEVFTQDLINEQGLIVLGAEKTNGITTNFSKLLWNAATVIFPSPRQKDFKRCMSMAVKMIETGALDISGFWSQGYDRETEWRDAFKEGDLRKPGYNRGYIEWH